MAQCPVCQAEIPDDFGLIECGHCGAQLIVQFDGSVEHASAAPVADAPAFEFGEPERELPAELSQALMADLNDESADQEPQELPSLDEFAPVDGEAVGEPEMAADPDFTPTDIRQAPSEEPREKRDIFADDFEEPSAAEADQAYRAPGTPPNSPDLSDIAQFGNSDASSGRDGSLRYNLNIQGIDTADVREAVREALTDRKFIWDTDAILRSIRNGEMKLENVTATKAFMLISRLRSLPVRVKWEQNAIHQP